MIFDTIKMVFSNPSPVVSDTESAPLTPEQVHFANLKSAELDGQLGLSPEQDPKQSGSL